LGRDRHPRSRRAAWLARKRGKRPPYDRVLIACEGSKTEPTYPEDIRQTKRIPSAHIKVLHSGYGTEPRQVVDFAVDKFREDRSFEWVFAVFDRDQHKTYMDALAQAGRLDRTMKNDEGKLVRFVCVPSVPCFELWLLLHFVNQQAYVERSELFARLRVHIPGYEKGARGIYALTAPSLSDAVSRAEWLRGHHNAFSGTDAYTDVDILVGLLHSLGAVDRG
jgi:RloB-like protein